MEICKTKDGWSLSEKVENTLDKFVLDCVGIVSRFTRYVLVSGYVVILVGRSRVTENVDMLIEPMDLATFKKFHRTAEKAGFEFINPEDAAGLHEMLKDQTSIRMARVGTIIPNLEMKYARDKPGQESLAQRQHFLMNGKDLFTSPFELQIPYKLYLGGDKDIEDAVFLWELLKDDLNPKDLQKYMKMMGVEGHKYGIG
jgi:hypothetical protein